MDSLEGKTISRQHSGLVELHAELAHARSMLDVIGTRLSAIPHAERADLEQQLASLRARWLDANHAFESATVGVGKERVERERGSRAVLAEVQDGLLRMIFDMSARFAGRASELAGQPGTH